jgi:hypothetical protein
MYLDLIYPSELEIKQTLESSTSALCLYILLQIDINGELTTQFYDNRITSPLSISYIFTL